MQAYGFVYGHCKIELTFCSVSLVPRLRHCVAPKRPGLPFPETGNANSRTGLEMC
jgi:hypothetical protein